MSQKTVPDLFIAHRSQNLVSYIFFLLRKSSKIYTKFNPWGRYLYYYIKMV